MLIPLQGKIDLPNVLRTSRDRRLRACSGIKGGGRILPALLLALFVGCGLCVADDQVITWNDCVREASNNNPELRAAREACRKIQAARKGVYGALFPQVWAEAGYERRYGPGESSLQVNSPQGDSSQESQPQGNSPQETQGIITTESEVRDEYSIGIYLQQPVYSGGRKIAAIHQSSAELEKSKAYLLQVQAEVSHELKSAFARLLYGQQLVTLTADIAGRRKENMDLVELRFEGGREHKGSFLLNKASYDEAQLDFLQAKRALSVARQGLAKALGREEANRVMVPGRLNATFSEPEKDLNAIAVENPQYLQVAMQARAAKAGVSKARGEFLPDISLIGSASRTGEDWPADENEWSGGIKISLPIFNGLQNAFGLQEAKAEYRMVQENAVSMKNQLLLDLKDRLSAFQSAVERVTVQQALLDAAKVRVEIAQAQYISGLLSFENWDLIENDLIRKQKDTLLTKRDAVLAEASWELAQGKGAIKGAVK